MASSLANLVNNQALAAYGWYERQQRGGWQNMGIELDPATEYDPLWILKELQNGEELIELTLGLSPRDLDSPVEHYTSSNATAEEKARAEYYHKKRNDDLYDNIQKSLSKLKYTDATRFELDEWYIDDPNTTEVRTTHPYSGLTEPGSEPQEPTQEPTVPENRDPYNYYPNFGDIEDIPSKLTAEDISPTIDDLGAAGYSAYKAGGGDAKVKEGFTIAEVIAIGKANIAAFGPAGSQQEPISNPEQDTPNLFNAVLEVLDPIVPSAATYKYNIAMSILKNEPVIHNPTKLDKCICLWNNFLCFLVLIILLELQ